ncbi:hypothetical protein P5F75_17470 [Caldifermentibacillus hisashii]|uniref:hypothetical protein n=1 Tax=Caldifermentibacillus hisashii TaxID=996558 RepID=UPI002E1A1EEA|nr:hypothetical protein [Caldifermentibacillus hisashii]
MATRLFLVVILRRETPFFGDETLSRRHFEAKLLVFSDETLSRRHFAVENTHFCRRNLFSSSFLGRKLHFLATRPVIVVTFGQETPFFGDETISRRRFEAGNSFFWRRDSFSSSF